MKIHNKIVIMDVCCVLSSIVCISAYAVFECQLQNNITGVPSSWATSGFPQYCAHTCARFGCTRYASVLIPNPPKKKSVLVSVSKNEEEKENFFPQN